MHVAILYPCVCCGHHVDVTLPEHRGMLINRRASLNAQIIVIEEMIERCKTAQKLSLKMQLHELTQELKGLPNP